MKKLLLLPLIIFYLTVNATDYYIASNGNDGNNGTSQSSPWQSLNKLNAAFGRINPGDRVLLRRGDTFYGSINVTKGGSSGSPIKFDAYGSGANPIITGFTNVNSWKSLGGNIWESSNTVSTLPHTNMVIVNGINTAMGRYPNDNFLIWNSRSGNTSITSSGLSGSPNWKGAELAFFTTTYRISRVPIINQSGGTLTYTPPANGNIFQAPSSYFVQNFLIQDDIRTLDSQNEWYYNPSTKKLSIYSTSSPKNVKIASINTLVNFSHRNHYISFENIDFSGAGENAFTLGVNNYVTIKNSNIDFIGNNAVIGQSWGVNIPGLIIENCNFDQINNSGIVLSRFYTNALITKSNFTNIGMVPGMMGNASSGHSMYGISVSGDENVVSYNNLDRIGYIGINFLGNNTIIKNNYVKNFCIGDGVKDGGGIYSWNRITNKKSGMRVLDNIVLHSGLHSKGIDLDDESHGIELNGNSVAFCQRGIYLHNAWDIQVLNNTTFDNSEAAFMLNGDNPLFSTTNITVNNNVFVSKEANQTVGWFRTVNALYLPKPFSANNNYYARPINDEFPIQTWYNGKFTKQTVEDFQEVNGQVQNSKGSPKTITNTNELRFEYNATTSDKTIQLNANYIDIRGKSYNGSITLEPYTSAVLIRNGAITNQNQEPTVNAGENKTYTLPLSTINLTGTANDPDGSIVSYSWVKLSGPSANIVSPATVSTTVSGLNQGVYKYQLTVTDNKGATANATVTITINSPEDPVPDLLPAVNPANTVIGLDYKYYEGSSFAGVPDFGKISANSQGTASNFDNSLANREESYALNFEGYINVPADGQYTFYTNSDDGSMLYIDGRLVVDNDGLHSLTEKSGEIGLKAGKHAITVGYFNQTGIGVLNVSYAGPGLSKQSLPESSLYRVSEDVELLPAVNPENIVNGLEYKYYEGSSFTEVPDFGAISANDRGTASNFDASVASRSERYALNFIGYIEVPSDGQYTFYTNSDDGSLLYIDGQLVVDNNGLHATNEKSGKIGLKAGKHAITLGYFNQTGNGVLEVSYAGPGLSKQTLPESSLYRITEVELLPAVNPANTVNGLDFKYYEGSSFTIVPDFGNMSANKEGTANNFNISVANRDEMYAINFTGFIDVPADGEYTFYASSDDGSLLYIDGYLVVDNDGLHGVVEKAGKIGLKAGKHVITVGYFNQTGIGLLDLSYAGPGLVKQPIPASSLYRVVISELLPAVIVTNPVNGLDYKYYEGSSFTALPDFGKISANDRGIASNFDISVANRAERYALNFMGYIDVPSDGHYTFYTNSDDGSKLYIDGRLVANNDGLHWPVEISGSIGLKAGKHAITVGYFNQTGNATLNVSYAGPGISKQDVPSNRLLRSSINQFAAISGEKNMSRNAPPKEFSDDFSAITKIEMKAYPNPFVNSITLSIISKAGDYKLILIDVLGRTLWNRKGSKSNGLFQHSINTSSLQKGIYFLKVIQNDKSTTIKIEK